MGNSRRRVPLYAVLSHKRNVLASSQDINDIGVLLDKQHLVVGRRLTSWRAGAKMQY